MLQRSAAFLLAALTLAAPAAEPSRSPVLIELFTSEGCSSCPPADQLLQQLDPQAIVLSEHVDYWDHQGWRDPYSSARLTARQEDYGRQFHIDGVYTPQMIVDGAVQFNGSDRNRALAEIAKAADRPKAAIRLSRSPSALQIEIDAAPRSSAVWLALADNSAVSKVAGGENQGRRLQHVAVVRSLKKIGTVKKGEPFRKTVALAAEDATRRAVVFLQDPGSPVTGAAMASNQTPAP